MVKSAQSLMLHASDGVKTFFHNAIQVSSAENEEAMYTAFTVTVDAREGISTGISAADRARTLRMLADPATQPADLRKPGHICPLRYALLLSSFHKVADTSVEKEWCWGRLFF